MGTKRHHLYREIHKGIRGMLHELVSAAGKADFTDGDQVDALGAKFESAIAFLVSHAEHENSFVEPLVVRVAPELAKSISRAHDHQDELFEELRARFVTARSEKDGHDFYVALSRVVGELLTHMADEEEVVMTVLWERLDDAELEATHRALLASIPPPEMMHSLAIMLPAIHDGERFQMLSGMRAGAPPPVFLAVLDLAKKVLTREEYTRLQDDLGVTTIRAA